MNVRTIKILWGRAASTCSICRNRLDEIALDGKPNPIGEAAHIIAKSIKGPRGNSVLSESERDSYLNLILVCPTCHTLIDSDTASYPVERLHMLKAEHELRVQGVQVPLALTDKSDADKDLPNLSAVLNFVTEWKSFLPFWHTLYALIETDLFKDEKDKKDILSFFSNPEIDERLPLWHTRRNDLKHLLFQAGEPNLVVQRIPNWERLKTSSPYVDHGGYLTPFSFILDFVNPYAMVNIHGSQLWQASFISQEFLDYLSFKYPEVRAVWSADA